MNTFAFVAFIIGCAVIAILGAILGALIISFVLYTIAFFMALLIVLIEKRIFKFFNKTKQQFPEQSEKANNEADSRRNTQYIKYFFANYFSLVFTNNRISQTIFNCLQKRSYCQRNDKSDKYILNLTPVPLNEQTFNGIHADKSSISDISTTTPIDKNHF
jgi:hypothetical protein